MSLFEIKSWMTGKVLFSLDCESMKVCVEAAIKKKLSLSSADLSSANLRSADLSSADLRSADLSFADLRSADLSFADLSSAILRSANLGFANLRSAKNADLAIARTRILPEGDLIGWKKCREGKIVKLRIPEAAKRSHALGRKCRAEFADVIEVVGGGKAESMHQDGFFYETGQRVSPNGFDLDYANECAAGVHFYITRIEAENHD